MVGLGYPELLLILVSVVGLLGGSDLAERAKSPGTSLHEVPR
jgi:Sec-independent protein translocase protein TatA